MPIRQFLPPIIAVLALTGAVVLGFTFLQAHEQQSSLSSDLKYRTRVLSESLKESIEPVFIANNTSGLQKLLDKFSNNQRLVGMAVYDSKGEVKLFSGELSDKILSGQLPLQSMDSDSPVGKFIIVEKTKVYAYVEPLHQDNAVIGAFLVVQRADYIDNAVWRIWSTDLLRLLLQALVFAFALVFILRWLVFKPFLIILRSISNVRLGKVDNELDSLKKYFFFRPFATEISKISASLTRARSAALEEARMRFEKLDTPWTADRLQEFIKAYLKGRKVFVISNREPYVHNKIKNKIQEPISIGGMVTAMEPVMNACGGMWIAQAMGSGDRETADKDGKLQVPAGDPKYTLKRIWLTEKEQEGFYSGFCNNAIWPLCHNAHVRPVFKKEDWQAYRRANGKFTEAILAEIRDVERPLILVQDFHLALLPEMIKKTRPDAQIGFFWHIPWPTPEVFNICPWHKEFLQGMLAADIIGFHTQQYCNNFLDTVGKDIESIIDLERFSVTFRGHTVHIKSLPISIAFTGSNDVDQEEQNKKGEKMLEDLGIKTEYLALGADRMDYTKGILERFKGVEFLLDMYPQYKNKFTLLQIAEPSRESVEKYRQFSEEVSREADRINAKFSKNGWEPIVLQKRHFSHEELFPLYGQANVCMVTSLHDGMNLVAKEFVAARSDESGVLILSQFTGASRDLKEAIIINPYSAESTAAAINEALNMPLIQQRKRMKKMRETIKNYNVYRWSAEFMRAIINLD